MNFFVMFAPIHLMHDAFDGYIRILNSFFSFFNVSLIKSTINLSTQNFRTKGQAGMHLRTAGFLKLLLCKLQSCFHVYVHMYLHDLFKNFIVSLCW